jgi:hypothetical protein
MRDPVRTMLLGIQPTLLGFVARGFVDDRRG